MSGPEKSSRDFTLIDDIENECYLKAQTNDYFRNEVKTKIEEFSTWFNSTARLYLLRCHPDDNETFIYLLLNLKKKLKFAISEINRSINTRNHSLTCTICDETVEVSPSQNFWKAIQEHPHFEETYGQLTDFTTSDNNFENGGSSMSESVDDLSEEMNNLEVNKENEIDPVVQPPENGLNSFKFNFVVTYDERVEEALYPETLVVAARKRDNVSEYTIQRCGAGRGVCLLCPCILVSRGRASKLSPYVVKNHTFGHKHLKCAESPVNKSALRRYHEFWHTQDPCFQAHQLHFMPETLNLNFLKCLLCQERVNYNYIVDHIKEKLHKNKILKLFYAASEGRGSEVYLLDMQVGVYDAALASNAAIKKEEKLRDKEAKEGTSNGTPSAVPKCTVVKSVMDPSGIYLPSAFVDHLKFFSLTKDLLTCKICHTNVSNTITAIRRHLYTQQHKQSSGIDLPKMNYFCEICNTRIKDETLWEEHFSKPQKRHDEMLPSRKQKLAEYECKPCAVVLYGDELSVNRHISTRGNKSGRNKEIRLPFSVRKFFKSKKFIEDEARRLQIEAIRVLEDQDKMKECCDDLKQAVSVIYPNCTAYAFGSRISGLGNNLSDLDIFMDTGDMYLGEHSQDSLSQEQFVRKVAKLLKGCKEDFSNVVPIPTARTPIVKVHHNYTNLDCDISFRHGLGVENTKFLRYCTDLQPVLQPFILLLKKWSDFCRLNEHITNYGLALMAVFYLQTGGYLLSVKTVRSYNPTQACVIDGWETLNYTVPVEKMKEFVKPYTGEIKILLQDFFSYFAKFDYENQVICPLLGTTIPKMLFNEMLGEKLPPEMASYVQRIQQENGEQFKGLTPFCIQDPFDFSHNLTKACQHGTITKFKALCNLTCELLNSIE